MRRLTVSLLVAASLAGVAGTAPAASARACDPEIQNCFYDCLRQAHLVVDPKDPQATLRGLLPMCPTA